MESSMAQGVIKPGGRMTDQTNVDEVTRAMVFEQMPNFLQADKAAGLNATINFDLSGDGGGQWHVKIENGAATSGAGLAENASLTLLADAGNYVKITLGQMDATAAFMQGKLKIKGDMDLAIKMQSLFKRPV